MTALALALALAAVDAQGGRLPPAPRRLYAIAWQRPLVERPGEWRPTEPGGPAYDPVTRLVVAGTRDGWLRALRPDGTVAWSFRGGGAFAGEVAIEGDTAYVGCDDGRLYAVALTTGTERWHYEAREQLATRPVIRDGTVFVASLQDTIFALDARTGAWRWHHHREPREGFTIRGAAGVRVDGGLVFGGFSDGSVVAVEAITGRVRWERQVAPSGDYLDVDSILVEGGRVYAAAYSGAVAALDAATGRPDWQVPLPEASRLVMAGGALVCLTARGVFGLSPSDGRTLWSAPLEGTPGGEPQVEGRWILVPAGDGGLRFLEAASGRTVRVLQPGTGVTATPALGGGRAFVLSNGGDLLALRLE